MAVHFRNIDKDYVISGVFSSAANFLTNARNGGSAEEGDMYYDTTLNQLRTYDGSNWSAAGINSTSAGSLNDGASIGSKITIDGSTVSSQVEIECSAGGLASGAVLLIDNDDTTNDPVCIEIDSEVDLSTAVAIDINAVAGYDIQGTGDTWQVAIAGDAMFNSVWLKDDKGLLLGTASGGDMKVDFNDDTPGTFGAGMAIAGTAAHEQVSIGDATYQVDLMICGTTTGIYTHWDASANELIIEGADLGLQDDDQLLLGNSDDVVIDWAATGTFQITPLTNNSECTFGTTTAAWDIRVYGDTATSILHWDSQYDRLNFESAASSADVMCQLDDYVQLTFGTGASGFGTTGSGDVQMWFDGTDFLIDASVADEGFKIGDTSSGFDITYYFEGSGITITTDYDGDVMTFTGCDLAFGDDDYILLGGSATAGGTSDGTIRWDNTDAKIEIVGATRFEQAVTMDSNLTVTGTLTHSGSFAPGSVTLADDEPINFGDSTDVVIDYDSSTSDLQINGAAASQGIDFGGGTTVDVRFSGSTANYDMQWDASRNHLLFNDNAVCAFGGTNDTAADYQIFTAGSTGPLVITAVTANDQVVIGGNSVATDFVIDNNTNAGSDIWWDESAQVFYYGKDGKGVDVKWYGETTGANLTWETGANLTWDQSQDALIAAVCDINICDNDLLTFGTGASAGAGDWKVHSDGADLFIAEVSAGDKEVDFGVDGTAPDVKFFGATTGCNMLWDQSADSLVMSDSSILKFGTGTDLYITTTGANATINTLATLTFSATSANQQVIVGTSDYGTDFRCNATGSTSAYLLWDASGDSGNGLLDVGGGTDGTGVDAVFRGATTGCNVTWDQSADALIVSDNTSLQIGAGSDLVVSTTGANVTLNTLADCQVSSTTANKQLIVGTTLFGTDFRCNVTTSATSYLLFDASGDSGAGSLNLGVDDEGIDLNLFGATTGITCSWDQSADALELGDDTKLVIGGGSDLTISTTGANVTFNTLANTTFSSTTANKQVIIGTTLYGTDFRCNATGSASAYLLWDASGDSGNGVLDCGGGTDGSGIDVIFRGATTGCNFTWDQSADSLLSGSNAILSFTNANGTTTENVFVLPSLTAAASLTTVTQGSMILDGQNDRLYVATAAGTWKSVTLT
jgi:hypothetical protein